MKKILLAAASLVLLSAVTASANPNQYGTNIYRMVSDRMSYTDINNDGEDDDGQYMLHTTMMDKVTGLGQETKLCEL